MMTIAYDVVVARRFHKTVWVGRQKGASRAGSQHRSSPRCTGSHPRNEECRPSARLDDDAINAGRILPTSESGTSGGRSVCRAPFAEWLAMSEPSDSPKADRAVSRMVDLTDDTIPGGPPSLRYPDFAIWSRPFWFACWAGRMSRAGTRPSMSMRTRIASMPMSSRRSSCGGSTTVARKVRSPGERRVGVSPGFLATNAGRDSAKPRKTAQFRSDCFCVLAGVIVLHKPSFLAHTAQHAIEETQVDCGVRTSEGCELATN